MYLWRKQKRVYEKFINRRRIMKPNRAKSINVVTKINEATNRWVLLTEKQNCLTFTFHFIHTASVRHKHKSTFTWINDYVSNP